jgi:hypothetical protein
VLADHVDDHVDDEDDGQRDLHSAEGKTPKKKKAFCSHNFLPNQSHE